MIVTVNPSGWEGDFRLMEAMATGAMILVDNMYVPRPHPLIHDEHIVYYDNNNKTDLFEKLDFYHKHVEQARRVAVSGYLHSMKYHRAANLIDYVFRTIHLKLVKQQAKDEQADAGGSDGDGAKKGGRRNNSKRKIKGTGLVRVPPIHPRYTSTGYHMRNKCKEFAAHHGEKKGK